MENNTKKNLVRYDKNNSRYKLVLVGRTSVVFTFYIFIKQMICFMVQGHKHGGSGGSSQNHLLISQLQQFPGSRISRYNPGNGKWFPGNSSRSNKFCVEKWKKMYIKCHWNLQKQTKSMKQTSDNIAVNHLSHSYDWKLVSDNMWYVRSKLISEGRIKPEGNSWEVYTRIGETKRELGNCCNTLLLIACVSDWENSGM